MKIKYLKHTVLFLTACLSLVSCKKNTVESANDPIAFPVTVYPTGSTAKFSMKMFVGGIEITDPGKISKFVSTMPATYSTADLVSKFPASYTFTSKDSIKFSANNNFFVSKTNDRYVITTITASAVNPLTPIADVENFFAFKTTSVPTISGYAITRKFAAYGDYTNFKVSVLNYKYRKPGSYNLTAYGLVTNEFNPASISQLGPTDTLAVQEFFINYK